MRSMLKSFVRRTRQQRQRQYRSFFNFSSSSSSYKSLTLVGCGLLGVSSYFLIQFLNKKKILALSSSSSPPSSGSENEVKKKFTKEEVSRHNCPETGIWVTYKDRVYDITEFVDAHPGGKEKIMLAAGKAIDPYWRIYQQHNKKEIFHDILSPFEIGVLELTQQEREQAEKVLQDSEDPFSKDPWDERNAVLSIFQVNSLKPYNAEPSAKLLVDNFITPNSLFYVRNHLPVPVVDEKEYRLVVEGEDILKPLSLTLDDLKKFPKYSVTSVIQCAGNRRTDMSTQEKPVRGLSWGVGAIGNAVWTGVRLRDVLKAAKIQVDEESEGGFKSPHGVEHIVFEGLDKDPTNAVYGASIPLETALSSQTEVILAYEMNGEPLSRDHGFPVRVVVPGVIGARSVKWLSKIVASQKESESFWQKKDYKVFDPSVDWNNVDFLKEEAVQAPNIQSCVCDYEFVEDEKDSSLVLKGYAWSGGGKRIKRVDVSTDGGVTWQVAEILPVPEGQKQQKPNHGWAWSLWTASIPASKLHKQANEKSTSPFRVCCKATDENFNVQPESADSIWNLRGLLCNSRHCITIKKDQQ